MTKVEMYQDQIVELYGSGKTIPQIAEILPMSKTRIGDVLRKLKLVRPLLGRKKIDPDVEKKQTEEIIRLYLEGMSIDRICSSLPKAWRFVQKVLKESGFYKNRNATEEEEKEIVLLYVQENMTLLAIAEKIGRSTPFISRILRKNQIKITPRKAIVSIQFKKEVERLYSQEGLAMKEIANRLNSGYHPIRNLIIEMGIVRRENNEQKVIKAKEKEDIILSLYDDEAHTVRSVSKLTGISYSLVRQIILKEGLEIRYKKRVDFESLKIQNGTEDAFTEKGFSYLEIGEKIEEFRRNYNKVATYFGINFNTVIMVAKKLDLYTPVVPRPYNTDFFEKIDSHEKAYILGLLASDGSNLVEFGSIKLSLKEQDYEIVSKVRDLLAPGTPIQTIRKNNPKWCDMVSLIITNRKMAKDLESLGIVDNKTFKLKVEDWLSGEFVNSAILGFHDGDGSFYYRERWGKESKPRLTPEKSWTFSFIGLRPICEFMQKTFKDVLGINSTVTPHSKYKNNEEKPLCTIRVYGNQQNKTLMDWLYKDCSIFMKRKHDNYLDMLEFLKTKRVNQFG